MNELTLSFMIYFDRLASDNHQNWLTNQWMEGCDIKESIKEDIIDIQEYDWDCIHSIY